MATFTINHPGTATLDETQRACKVDQQDETGQLKGIEGVVNVRSNGTRVNINVATYEEKDSVLDILDDLLFINVETQAGVNAALAANHTHTPIGGPQRQRIFVQNKLTEVQLFGKKS